MSSVVNDLRVIDINVVFFKRGIYEQISIDADEDSVYCLSAKQCEAMRIATDKTTDFLGYGGAAFGGKTAFLCCFLLMMCWAYPETNYAIVRRELKDLRNTVLESFKEMLAFNGLVDGEDYNYNQKSEVINFRNGSKIYLLAATYKPSDPLYEGYGSYNFTIVCVEESAEVDYKAIEMLYIRTGRKKNKRLGIKRKVIETFNPNKGHVYSRYYKPYKEGILADSMKFVRALPSDNPSPEAEEYVRGILEHGSEATIQRMIKGNFEYDESDDKIVDYHLIMDSFSLFHLKEDGGTKYMCADVAGDGKDPIIVWVYHGIHAAMFRYEMDKKLIEEGRKVQKKLGDVIFDWLEGIRIKHEIARSNCVVDANGVGTFLKGTGYREFIAGAKDLLDGEKYDINRAWIAYKFGERIAIHDIFINVDNTKLKLKIAEEIDAHRKYKQENDFLKKVTPKRIIKANLRRSPDDYDALSLIQVFVAEFKYKGSGVTFASA